MEKDSHYYVMYLMCLVAGLSPEEAYVVSYSSQYVDDSTDGCKHTLLDQNSKEFGKLDPIRTAHNGFESIGIDVQEKIYYPFHFLPSLTGGSFDQMMIARPGMEGVLFKEVLQEALKSDNLYRIGISLHVLADTYSHANFSGLWTWDNDVKNVNYIPARKGWFTNLLNKCKWLTMRKWFEIAPAIGHSQAYVFPDLPYLNWKYFDYLGELKSISNSFNFRKGFGDLYELLILKYAKSRKLNERTHHDELIQILWKGIRIPGSLKKRCKYWQGAIKQFAEDKKLIIPAFHLKYGDHDWEKRVVKRLKKFGLFSSLKMKLKVPVKDFEESHYLKFHNAALEHRRMVMEKINEYLSKDHQEKKRDDKTGPLRISIPLGFIKAAKEKKILERLE